MTRRLLVIAIVLGAVGVVLWLKSTATPPDTVRADAAVAVSSSNPDRVVDTTVLLFADPREAEQSCGCAEIIRIARNAGDIPGVVVREIDTRQPGELARRHEARVSPTVIITDAAGRERIRFEGESVEVIEELKAALARLRTPSAPGSQAEPAR